MSDQEPTWKSGPLAFMAQNGVAANLIMAVFILGGIFMATQVKQEVFPEIQLDRVNVQVVYPGAGPEEVEQGVVLAVEEAVRSVDGIKEVRSTAGEGVATVSAELLTSTDATEALNDIKSAVDRVTSLPQDAERPVISLASNRQQVISLVIYGDASEKELRTLGEEIRDELLQDPDITVVELGGVRDPEISIEVPQEELRRYGLTLEQIRTAVARASIELPGGGVKTDRGEVLLRTTERREFGHEFNDVIVLAQPDGSVVTLGEIATIKDTFADVDLEAYYDGKRAIRLDVYRIGDQTPIEIADIVKEYVADKKSQMPPKFDIVFWNDRSEIYADRVGLLVENAMLGLILVLLLLGLFLEVRLAFWVTTGIIISVLGVFLLMPVMDVSINMISLFAFILTLGIVVDDAIVAGEAVHHHRGDGESAIAAAINGIREVAMPITFSVLTTVVAFVPLLFVPGIMGKFFRQIPLIVIPILLISLVEALFVLPAHLGHESDPRSVLSIFLPRFLVDAIFNAMDALSAPTRWFGAGLDWFIETAYQPFAERAFRYRYVTIAVGIGALFLTFGFIGGGFVKFTFMPKVEGDIITASVEMPFGTPAEDTRRVARLLEEASREIMEENGGVSDISRGIYSSVGASIGGGGGVSRGSSSGSHLASVQTFLVPVEERDIKTSEFTAKWRQKVGEVPGVESLTFKFNIGPQAGDPVNVELSHRDNDTLEAAASSLASKVETYAGVFDVNDGFAAGKEQLDLTLKPAARAMGITESDLARQVRNAFFGAEVTRQQRGRDEVRIFVRRPKEERISEFDIEQLLIQTPQGGEIPLRQAANINRGRSYTSIVRVDGRRVVSVTGDVDDSVTSAGEVMTNIQQDLLPRILADTPGLSYSVAGEEKERGESLGALFRGFFMALFVMYALMAVAFRSYVQPAIIVSAIPFGLVGAVFGHVLLGFNISIMTMMGLVALSGVVVNDSIVLVTAINEYSEEMSIFDAVVAGVTRRFRPILLTSLTTFFGLAPMIFETSPQARFLAPMAVSLGFGILFVTFIALLLVPCLYLILEDMRRVKTWLTGDDEDKPETV